MLKKMEETKMKKVTRTRLNVLTDVFAKAEYKGLPYLDTRPAYSTEQYYELQYEVRWCSKGGTDPVEAYFFGEQLKVVAEIAKAINALDLKLDENKDAEDPMIKTKEDFEKWVELFDDVIKGAVRHGESGQKIVDLYIKPFLTEDDCSAEFEDYFVD